MQLYHRFSSIKQLFWTSVFTPPLFFQQAHCQGYRRFSYRDRRESLYVTMTTLKEGGRGGKYYRCVVFEIWALQHQLLCFPVRSQRARCSTRVRNGRDPGKTLSGGRWETEEERAAKRLSQEGGVLGRQPKLYSPIVGQPDTVCEANKDILPLLSHEKKFF